MRSPTGRAWRLLALTMILAITAAPAALGQVNEQVSGTVESIWGPTLVLRTNPPPPRRVTFGESARPVAPAVPAMLEVDLDNAPASQWVFLRPGERIAVVGVSSADGRRFNAIRVIGGAGPPRSPEAP
jgi:hypothetical protein